MDAVRMKFVSAAMGGAVRAPVGVVSHTEFSSWLPHEPRLVLQGKLILLQMSASPGTWFPHLLHEGKLERFFFFLASLMMVNTLGLWAVAHRYV